ncbi:N-acetyltransferase family protein [Methylomagnum sp.]
MRFGPARFIANPPAADRPAAPRWRVAGRKLATAPARLIEKLRAVFAEFGPKEAVLFILARLVSTASRGHGRLVRYWIVAQPILPQIEPRLGNTVIGEVSRAHAVVAEFPRPPEVIAMRFDNGGVCLVAWLKEKFAGYLWYEERRYVEDHVRCVYELAEPERTVWDYDVYVAPEFRLGRTFIRLWDAANARFAERGYAWSLSRIEAFNRGSVDSHFRFGTMRLATATFLCLGPAQLALFSCPPYLHWSTRDSNLPILRLTPPQGSEETRPHRAGFRPIETT